jgi:uncharacterized membrane protein YdbT with pleckstrin-like domain
VLLPNEKVLYRTHRHWIVFGPVMVWAMITLILWMTIGIFQWVSFLVLLLTLIIGGFNFINYQMSELAVTNMRVIVKVGFVARYSLETTLQNIASIGVGQSVLGRLLGYGTLNVCDTGNVHSPFSYIENPLEFRKAFLSQVDKRFPVPE